MTFVNLILSLPLPGSGCCLEPTHGIVCSTTEWGLGYKCISVGCCVSLGPNILQIEAGKLNVLLYLMLINHIEGLLELFIVHLHSINSNKENVFVLLVYMTDSGFTIAVRAWMFLVTYRD